MRRLARGVIASAALLLLWANGARAHEGPPIPLVVDRPVAGYSVSVWSDPDVGVGKFWVILEAAPGKALVHADSVQVCVRPLDGRLPEACFAGTAQKSPGRDQFYAEVDFDRQEMWQVIVRIAGPAGTGEVSMEVEATPPGFGAWDLLFYGFPFILFGGLWAYAALRRRAERRSPATSARAGAVETTDAPTDVRSRASEGER